MGHNSQKRNLLQNHDFCFFELNLFPSIFLIQNLGGGSAITAFTGNKNVSRSKTNVIIFIGIQFL